MGDDRERIAEAVTTSHLFEDMSEEGRHGLIDAARVETFEAGQVILAEGETGDDLYLVLSGNVEVSIHVERGEKKLARLSRGDVFGEIAGLLDHRRYATVTAINEGAHVARFHREPVDSILDDHGHIRDKLHSEGKRRLAETAEVVLAGE